jgi:hypothetical protein
MCLQFVILLSHSGDNNFLMFVLACDVHKLQILLYQQQDRLKKSGTMDGQRQMQRGSELASNEQPNA